MDNTLDMNKNLNIFTESVIYNSSAFVELVKGKNVPKGNVTEVGLLKYLIDSKIDVHSYIQNKNKDGFIEFTIPFNSTRKRQTTAVRFADGSVRVFVKGGPEIVMPFCTKQISSKGLELDITENEKLDLLNVTIVKQFAQKCYRTLLVSYVDYSESDWETLKKQNNNF